MTLEDRMCALERESGRWRLVCAVQALILLVLVGLALAKPKATAQADDGVLRARGLIISDANGKARVLVGAPLPETKDRLRKDSGYEAMVFLDDQGHDRISLGQELPAQINGIVPTERHRIAPGYGFIIDDPKGNERGGFGFLDNGRAVLALDRPSGDAWAAIVDDRNGFAGTLSIYDRSVGENATGIFSGTQGKRAFINLKDSEDRPRAQLEVGTAGKLMFNILNENGKVEKDLVRGPAR